MININIKCDRCGNIIMGSKRKYYKDDKIYRNTSTENHMYERLKSGYDYNVFIKFDDSKWEPNTTISKSGLPNDMNGFILCTDCLEQLEKFIMESDKK